MTPTAYPLTPDTRLSALLTKLLSVGHADLAQEVISNSFRSPMDVFTATDLHTISVMKRTKKGTGPDVVLGSFSVNAEGEAVFTPTEGNSFPENLIRRVDAAVPTYVLQEIEQSRMPEVISTMRELDSALRTVYADEEPAKALQDIHGIGKRSLQGLGQIFIHTSPQSLIAEMDELLSPISGQTEVHAAEWIFVDGDGRTLGRLISPTGAEPKIEARTYDGPSVYAGEVLSRVVVAAAARVAVTHSIAEKMREAASEQRAEREARLQEEGRTAEARRINAANATLEKYSVKRGELFVIKRDVFHEDYGFQTQVNEAVIALTDIDAGVFLAYADGDITAFGPHNVRSADRVIDLSAGGARQIRKAYDVVGHPRNIEEPDADDFEGQLRMRGWET